MRLPRRGRRRLDPVRADSDCTHGRRAPRQFPGPRPCPGQHATGLYALHFLGPAARAGQYTGLREDEFREALDRLGEHYAALRTLLKDADPKRWSRLSELLSRPDRLIETADGPSAADRPRPSGLVRSSTIR